jgi:sugar lactone lactonase YvrE
VSDRHNRAIREINVKGEVTTLAPGLCSYIFKYGKRINPLFNLPYGICFDSSDRSLLVCDRGNNALKKVTLDGEVTTLCTIREPLNVVTDCDKILVSAKDHKIYKVTKSQNKYVSTVLAGSGAPERIDGSANECAFHCPQGMALHKPSNSCFVADSGSHTIRRIKLF